MFKTANKYSGPIHGTVEGFVKGMKEISHPVTKGTYLTQHMGDAGFQKVLQQHPLATKIRTSVNNYLNSPANMVGAKAKINSITLEAFLDEFEKISGAGGPAWHYASDLAGLGVLAAPTIQKMRGKDMSEKGTRAAELGGLGLLAAPVAHNMFTHFRGH